MPFPETRAQPSGLSEHESLLDRVDDLMRAIATEFGRDCETSDNNLVDTLITSLGAMRQAVADRDLQLVQMSERSEALARAQADAIVRSAEIIDELERTRQHLSDTRAAAEEAAQDTQRLADTIFERTHDGVLVLQRNACIACNDNTLKLFNADRSAIIGFWPKVFDSAQDEDGASAAGCLRSACDRVAAGAVTTNEVMLSRTVNGTFWAEITMSAFNMKDSDHVLVIVRDVTARKQFEAELRRHRDFLDNIINAVPDQICVKNVDHRLVVANDAFCRMHGVERDDVVGEDAQQFLPVEFRDRIEVIENELISTGTCKSIEYDFAGADGKRGVVSVKRSVFQDTDSGDRYIVSASRDITDDRIREERLRLLASVFKGASEGVAILGPDAEIREANPAFLRMIGSAGPLVGRLLTDVLRFDHVDGTGVLGAIGCGTSWAGKARYVEDAEQERSYWISLSPSSEIDDDSKRIIALVSDITELEHTQSKLRQQAMYDTLTGLPNRRYFRDHVQQLITSANRHDMPITICFLDLDDFKHVNDSAGHSVGDQLLRAVSRRLQDVLGEGTFIARFGGDEFAAILPGSGLAMGGIMNRMDTLLSAFRKPFPLGGNESVVGLSIGLTTWPDHAEDVDTLLCNADIAMYAAKSAGKNRVREFSSQMQDSVNTRHQIQSKLRRALSEGEIKLWFQPKVYADTRQPQSCEALARWQTPDGNFIPPCDFIPVAEQTGLILPLGALVFRLAAEQACEWFSTGITPSIAVNVSPHQLRHPKFVEQLNNALAVTGARAEWFELEITENAMMDDVDHAAAVIDELADNGFRIAIDDFGTGYSSLSYLKNFRIHTLKIDLTFVRDVTNDPQSNAVVRSIISLGTGLGLNVVAEGVETVEQADVLTDSGCTILQGYYFGRPMPADTYVEWLKNRSDTNHESARSMMQPQID